MIKQLSTSRGLLIAVFGLLLLVMLFTVIYGSINNRFVSFSLVHQSVAEIDKRLPAYSQASSALMTSDAQQLHGFSDSIAGKTFPAIAQLKAALEKGDLAGARTLGQSLVSELNKGLDKQDRLRTMLFWAGLLLFFAYFLLIVIPQILKRAVQEEVKVEAQQESTDIMDTINEGLFLLDTNHEIGIEQSKSLRELFRLDRQLEGNFFDFISQYVPDKTVQTAKDFLELLFKKRVKEKLIKDLNPLDEVEINIVRRDGSFENRYLDFSFNRVVAEDELQHLLVSVRDITNEVQLRNELEAAKEEQEAQMELLMRMFNMDKQTLKNFVVSSEAGLDEINQVLEQRGYSDAEIRGKLLSIAQQAHRLKGDSAALGLHGFEFTMHEFETQIGVLQEQGGKLSGKALLPAVSALKDAYAQLDRITGIASRFSDLDIETGTAQGAVATGAKSSGVAQSGISAKLHNLTSELSKRRDVRVNLTTFGLQAEDVQEELDEVISSSAIQLLRNSIVHGYSSPEQRIANSKPDFLSVTASLSQNEKEVRFIIRDDGKGIDQDAVIAKGKELGIVDADAENVSLGKIIFHPKFSSAEEADLDAGRGVGLSAVYSMVKQAGGSIMMSHAPHKYCQFQLVFPRTA